MQHPSTSGPPRHGWAISVAKERLYLPRKITPDDLLAFQLAGEPQLSPDGHRLAYVVSRIDQEKNEYRHQIFMMDAVPGARPTAFTAGPKSDRNPRWSPDGSQLAFLSDRSGKQQIWVISALGGEARQLTRYKDGVGSAPVWSPNGARIAFTAAVGPDGPGSDQDKDTEEELFKKYTKGVKRITRIHYKTDGEGFHDPDKREQIFVMDVAGEAPRPQQVTRGAWNHAAPGWSPNGQAIAFVANRRADDDYYPFLQDLWVQELDQIEAGPRCISPGTFSLGTPAWSPDGRQIAFLGYEHERFQGYSSNRLWVVAADGSGLRRIDRNWDRTFGSKTSLDMPAPAAGSLTWTPDGRALIAIGADRGRQQIYTVDTTAGTVTPLTIGDHVVLSWSLDANCKKLAVGLTTPAVPGDIYLVDGPQLHRLTNINEHLLAELSLAPVDSFRFKTGGGSNAFLQEHGTEGLEAETDGWIMKPADFSEHRRYPAVLEVHGGPMGQYGWTFMMEFQCLAAEGYAVVYANPRGSQGYSEQFCACIKEDWGNLDYLDVMASLEAAIARHPWIDADRVGIAGGSYGGFMVNWALGQSERFKAAITMRSCVNEASMVGTSDFGFVDMAYYPSRPWNDMSFYQRFSTITNVEKIVTPLLIEHQEEDYRCPMEQAEQLYTALKVLRRPVEFVRYPDSSHGMSRTGKPWLRVHRLRNICDWFGRYIMH